MVEKGWAIVVMLAASGSFDSALRAALRMTDYCGGGSPIRSSAMTAKSGSLSGGGFFGGVEAGVEVSEEAGRVGGEKGLDTPGVGRAKDEAGVVELVEAVDDFGVVVDGGIGPLLAGKRDEAAGVVEADGRERVVFASGESDLDAGPFDPRIQAGGVLDDVGDVGAADPGACLEEVEATVVVRTDEFGVGDACLHAEGTKGSGVDVEERGGFGTGAVEGAGGKDSAGVRGLEGRLAVLVRSGEEDAALPGDAFDMEDVAGEEALDEMVAGRIAEAVEDGPDIVWIFWISSGCADGGEGRTEAGLEEPGAFGRLQEAVERVVIGDGAEGRDGHVAAGRALAHGKLVAEETRCGLAEAGEEKMFAGQGGGFKIELVERNDARAMGMWRNEVGNVWEGLFWREVFRNGVEAGEELARPVGVAELVHREEMDLAAEARSLAEKGLAFFVGADAEDSGPRHRGGKVPRGMVDIRRHTLRRRGCSATATARASERKAMKSELLCFSPTMCRRRESRKITGPKAPGERQSESPKLARPVFSLHNQYQHAAATTGWRMR